MSNIDLRAFREGIAGRPYVAFLRHHIEGQKEFERMGSIGGLRQSLAQFLSGEAEAVVNRWVSQGAYGQLDARDCAELFDSLHADLQRTLGTLPDEVAFNFFQFVSLQVAQKSIPRLVSPGNKTLEGLLSLLGLGLVALGVWRILAGELLMGALVVGSAFVVWRVSYWAGSRTQ